MNRNNDFRNLSKESERQSWFARLERLELKTHYREYLNVLDFGTDYLAFQKAIDAAKCIIIPGDGREYTIPTKLSLPNADRKIVGIGKPLLKTVGTNAIFEATNHGVLAHLNGISFSGGGPAFHWNGTENTSNQYDYRIDNCDFDMDADIYALKFQGARNGFVDFCYFHGGNGIYSNKSHIRYITNSIFTGDSHVGLGIYDDGQGSAYSTGSYLENCTIMNYAEAVKIVRSQQFAIRNSTIDFNTKSIQLLGQNGGTICAGSYIGASLTAANPAIDMQANGGVNTTHILIGNSQIKGNWDGDNTYDCIYMVDTDFVQIVNNIIAFYTRYGINSDSDDNLKVIANKIHPRVEYGVNGLSGVNSQSTCKIIFNDTPQGVNDGVNWMYFNNMGYVTENSGTATIPNGSTSVDVTHSLALTPNTGELLLTPMNNMGDAAKYWISNVGATTFRVNVDTDPGATTAVFGWMFRKRIY